VSEPQPKAAHVGQAFQPDSSTVKLESLTYFHDSATVRLESLTYFVAGPDQAGSMVGNLRELV
jgi:hypothetical protein